jgi:hypothetical protein
VHDDTAIVEAIAAICDEFEFYGWRRVRAEPAASRLDDRRAISSRRERL